jgi:hypothetical protein
LKRWVFNLFLKLASEGHYFSAIGSMFHSLGAELEKA